MENGFYVYEHIRKDTGAIFYVGKGKDDRATSKHGRNKYWNRIVKKAGFIVKYVALNIDEELAFLVESERIVQLKKLNLRLTNMTEGGDGISGYKFTEDQKQKVSEACKQHANKPEVKEANSKARKGIPWSDSRRAACKGKHRVKKYDEKSKKGSAEHRARQSIAQLSKPIVTCPHCGKSGRGSAMIQWHFDKCKAKA